jgi:hypothetical protein
MLSAPDKIHDEGSDIDSIHNYYEHIVLEEIVRQLAARRETTDFIADVACVALNHLPPRYIRHNVDMVFYLSPKESDEIAEKVAAAVRKALFDTDAMAQAYTAVFAAAGTGVQRRAIRCNSNARLSRDSALSARSQYIHSRS